MFYVLASCMLLAVSSCELVSEPDDMSEHTLNTGFGDPGSGSDLEDGPE